MAELKIISMDEVPVEEVEFMYMTEKSKIYGIISKRVIF